MEIAIGSSAEFWSLVRDPEVDDQWIFRSSFDVLNTEDVDFTFVVKSTQKGSLTVTPY
jgi:hypothetical protein